MVQNTTDRSVPSIKLRPPRLPAGRISRPRLLSKLDEGLESDVVLIAAPAGYGKTTLLCQWLEHQPLPSAWLSLEARDSEPLMFVAGLVASIRTVHPGCCGGVAALTGFQGLSLVDAVAEELADELDDVGEFVLVLDDCDAIREGDSVALLDRLVRRMPRGLHLVLACRREPALSLGSLRGLGRLAEVRVNDLRFGQDEAAVFLRQATDAEYSPAQVASLVQRTEGWIAGLRLAALSLRDHEDRDSLIDDFTGSNRYVADYLMHEILTRLPSAAEEFLLSTAVLERLCRSLCRAVIGPDAVSVVDGCPMLEWLEQENLFVVALDSERTWFRYHTLFRDLLLHKLRVTRDPDEIAELHRRAGMWFAADGQIDPALDHLLAAGDVRGATAVVVEARVAAENEERWYDLHRWTRRLPREAVDREPELLVAEAWGYHLHQSWSAVRRNVDRAELFVLERAPSAEKDLLQSEIEALRAEVFYWQGDSERTLAAARRATELAGTSRSQARALAQIYVAGGLMLQGDLAGARRSYQGMLDSGAPGVLPARGLVGMAMLELMAGDLTAACQVADSMELLGAAAGSFDSVGFSHWVRGFAAYQRNELSAAEPDFAALAWRPFRSHIVPLKHSLFGLALAQWARGAPEQAASTAAKAVELLASAGDARHVFEARAFQVRLELLSGNSVTVEDWLAAFGEPAATTNLSVVSEFPALTLAQALIASGTEGDLDRAEALLARLRETAERTANTFRRIQVRSLQAVLHDRRGEFDLALEALAEAVELGRPGGFVRVYADLGDHLLDPLERLRDGGRRDNGRRHDDHLLRIIAAFARGQADTRSTGGRDLAPDTPAVPADVAYLLTNRELDVLALLDQRLSNKEIARRLVIAPATVKRHTLSIYSKLHVGGRREAAIRAHELGLLPLR